MRGFLDRLFGGIGLRRGLRSQDHIKVGDALDFWHVLAIEPSSKLFLVAEMKLPGKATLEFNFKAIDENTTQMTPIARFKPKGLLSILYWFSILPLHHYVFDGMIQKFKQFCEYNKTPPIDSDRSSV